MLKSIRARLQRVETWARREPDLNIPPIEIVDENDFDSKEAFEARVAEITSWYLPEYDGIKVILVERPEWHNDESESA